MASLSASKYNLSSRNWHETTPRLTSLIKLSSVLCVSSIASSHYYFYQISIFIHPIIIHGKLIHDLILNSSIVIALIIWKSFLSFLTLHETSIFPGVIHGYGSVAIPVLRNVASLSCTIVPYVWQSPSIQQSTQIEGCMPRFQTRSEDLFAASPYKIMPEPRTCFMAYPSGLCSFGNLLQTILFTYSKASPKPTTLIKIREFLPWI